MIDGIDSESVAEEKDAVGIPPPLTKSAELLPAVPILGAARPSDWLLFNLSQRPDGLEGMCLYRSLQDTAQLYALCMNHGHKLSIVTSSARCALRGACQDMVMSP